MAGVRRRDLNDILEIMAYDSDSSSSSSSNEEMDMLFLDTLFDPTLKMRHRLDFQALTDSECVEMFRFEKNDIERLCTSLRLPNKYTCRQGTTATGLEALMIMLRRLTYPNRWSDLVPLFGRSDSEMSLIFNTIVEDIYLKHRHLLESLDLTWLDLQQFSDAIYAKGAPLKTCWGFIDGTVRPIARPVRNQRIMFSGHKRVHCIKFQSIHAPNGLISHMYGPIEGRRHDAFMLAASGVSTKLEQLEDARGRGERYVIYGDPAYGVTRFILAPFRGANLTEDQKEFNKRMSKVRVSVEWGFGKICTYFAYLDFKKNLKVLLQPVAKYYIVGALMTNCHTCLYGSLSSTFFKVDPPCLETYLLNE